MNPGPLHWRQILYHLNYQRSPGGGKIPWFLAKCPRGGGSGKKRVNSKAMTSTVWGSPVVYSRWGFFFLFSVKDNCYSLLPISIKEVNFLDCYISLDLWNSIYTFKGLLWPTYQVTHQAASSGRSQSRKWLCSYYGLPCKLLCYLSLKIQQIKWFLKNLTKGNPIGASGQP